MKRALFFLLLSLVALLVIRAVAIESRQITASSAALLKIDRTAALARFSRAVQFQTISFEGPQDGPLEHEAFIDWLIAAYPEVHDELQREVVDGRSLLYTWKGTDPALPAILLMGHYDVVPIEPGTEAQWTHAPFGGVVADGYVWGRGTLDDKITVIGLLEAASALTREGFRPRRTVYFSFGHDEEIGGERGAAVIARLLQARPAEDDRGDFPGGARYAIPGHRRHGCAVLPQPHRECVPLRSVCAPGTRSSARTRNRRAGRGRSVLPRDPVLPSADREHEPAHHREAVDGRKSSRCHFSLR